MRPVGFTELGDWSPVGYINQFVWIAFDERLVATGERNGPDNHAGIWIAEDFLERWSGRLIERGWEWVAPFIERLANGDDSLEVEAHAFLEYSQRHGGSAPPVHNWEIDPDRYRPGE
ncbi:hypothetical protein GCM10027421_10370 [Microbacterium shaanxiense]